MEQFKLIFNLLGEVTALILFLIGFYFAWTDNYAEASYYMIFALILFMKTGEEQ